MTGQQELKDCRGQAAGDEGRLFAFASGLCCPLA